MHRSSRGAIVALCLALVLVALPALGSDSEIPMISAVSSEENTADSGSSTWQLVGIGLCGLIVGGMVAKRQGKRRKTIEEQLKHEDEP